MVQEGREKIQLFHCPQNEVDQVLRRYNKYKVILLIDSINTTHLAGKSASLCL